MHTLGGLSNPGYYWSITNAAVSDFIRKVGITDNVIASANDALRAHELIKCKVLENSMLTAREACDLLSEACSAEQVQVIGTKFVLFRRNPKEPKIELVKAKK